MNKLKFSKDDILLGKRRAIGKAITLLESTLAADRTDAQELLKEILPFTGKSKRIGFTGTPGVGKSTFIEAFGKFLTGLGHKVAVLAIDPSSQRAGGSILGDKTRMEELSIDPNAFIRPSPSSGTLGGVARHTREAVLILEAAGYDIIIVETVGVGQSETAVADLVDMFILLLSPTGGDDLQGIKRGIMELADLVIINKADGDLKVRAMRAAAEQKNALHLMRPKYHNWQTDVLLVSALKSEGILEVWQKIEAFYIELNKTETIEKNRKEQSRSWMWSEIKETLLKIFAEQKEKEIKEAELKLLSGEMTAASAADELLKGFIKNI